MSILLSLPSLVHLLLALRSSATYPIFNFYYYFLRKVFFQFLLCCMIYVIIDEITKLIINLLSKHDILLVSVRLCLRIILTEFFLHLLINSVLILFLIILNEYDIFLGVFTLVNFHMTYPTN